MKTGVIVFLICLRAVWAWGQFDKNYTPIPVVDTIPPDIYDSLKKKFIDIKSTDPSGQIKRLVNKIYADRNEELIKLYNDGYFMTEGELTQYLKSIVDRILASNPEIPKDVNVFPYRSEELNAMSFGEGTIGVMLGLLDRLESEEELAFVICHEIAHYTRDHLGKSVHEFARINYNKAIASQIQQINANEYERYSNMKKLLNILGLSISHHSRKHEFEADSVGFMYYRNTPYGHQSPVRLLEVLDSIDIPRDRQLLDLKSRFNFPDYPFNASWLAYSRSNIPHKDPREGDYGASDTMRTHPDCKRRILAIKRIESKVGELRQITPYENTVLHARMRTLSAFETIESTYYFKRFGKSLFETIQLQKKYPQNIYLQSMCGRILYRLYQSQKNHEFGKYVSMQNPYYEENYDRFLSFLHAMRLSDLSALSYYSVTTRPEAFFSDEEFLYTFWLVSNLPVSQFSPVAIGETYLKEYPSGIHAKTIKEDKR